MTARKLYFHRCAAFGCPFTVPIRQLTCKRCWSKLSREIHDLVYATYQPNADGSARRSPAWRRVVAKVQETLAVQGDMFDSPGFDTRGSGALLPIAPTSATLAVPGARSAPLYPVVHAGDSRREAKG